MRICDFFGNRRKLGKFPLWCSICQKALNSLKNKDTRFQIHLNNSEDAKELYLNKAFFIYQNFIDSWKAKDLEIVKEFFLNEDYKIVAQKVNIDQSNAWRRKKSLNILEYNNIKKNNSIHFKPKL